MRIDRGLLGWGVFLIVLGAVPLAVRAGYLDTDTVHRAWELWPLILIGIGLGLVLQRTRIAALGGLVVAITFGLIGGSVLAVGVGVGLPGCNTGIGTGEGTAFTTQTGTLGAGARVELELNCGDLTVGPAAGSTWTVAGTDRRGDGPDILAASDRLRVRSRDRSGIGFVATGERWQVTLPADPAVTLNVSVNAGSARLDLTGAHVPDATVSVNAGEIRLNLSGAAEVGRLNASANAGSLRLSLPAASLTGTVSANAGSVDVCVPAGVGLRFRASDNPLSSNNFEARGLVNSGRTWTSPGFDAATARIDLSADANVGSITLNPEAGCD
jgi:Domain of unknown function (DUF5668)